MQQDLPQIINSGQGFLWGAQGGVRRNGKSGVHGGVD